MQDGGRRHLGREVGGGAFLELAHRGQHGRDPERQGKDIGLGLVEQHAGERMTPATGAGTGKFLRPPVELDRRHLRLADAVGSANDLPLKGRQRDVSVAQGGIEKPQGHPLLRIGASHWSR